MSEQQQESNDNPNAEVTRKVVISGEDCKGAADFWVHFEVPMPPELKAAFEAFEKNPTLANQDEIKLQITRAIGHTDHEAFNDEMFKEIVAECRNVNYDLSFDKSLETTLREAEAAREAQAATQATTETKDK